MAVGEAIGNAADAIKQKLANLKDFLQFGKGGPPGAIVDNWGGKPNQRPQPGGDPTQTPSQPAPPGADPRYPREPDTGLSKRGAALAPVQATQQQPTDNPDEQKPAPPTITPVTPQGAPKAPAAGGGPGQQKPPYITDEDWARQNPGAVPALPSYQAPGKRSTLLHMLAYGATGFANPALGATLARDWTKGNQDKQDAADTAKANYPQTIHSARQKAETDAATLEHTKTETANLQSEIDNRGKPVPRQNNPREQMEQDYADQVRKGDEAKAKVTLDILTRTYPENLKNQDAAEMAKIPPQILTQSGPKPVTPSYAPPGQPPKVYPSTAEAQAAWGEHVQELQTKATSETTKLDPLIESQIGPQPQREHFQVGPIGDAAFTAANKAWGVAGQHLKSQAELAGKEAPAWQLDEDPDGKPVWVNPHTREVKPANNVQRPGTHAKDEAATKKEDAPLQDVIDKQKELQGLAAEKTGPGDIALTLGFIEATRPKAGFRMTQTEWNMILKKTRSSLGDAQALLHNVESGQLLTDTQRSQMLDTVGMVAKIAQERLDRNKAGRSGTGTQPAAGQPAAGPQPGQGKPAKLVNGVWTDATTGKPITAH